nr:ABC transporter ATP-binding protein [Corynebacterium efficiens]
MANRGRSVSRSAISGRFVTKAHAKRSPKTTVNERVGKGTSNKRLVTRSAISGRFVTDRWGKENPGGTIRQRV